MRSSYETAIAFVLAREGGYSLDPFDPGGETKWGISKRSHPGEDIKNLTVERAKEIYLEEYWNAIGADMLQPLTDIVAFDAAVNQGVSFARGMINECGDDEIAMLFYRLKKYSAIVASRPTSLKYLRGWMNRVAQLYDLIKEGT